MGVLSGKVAVVTGSSRGIGAAIARLFAQAGASVVVHGRDEAAITAVQTDIERAGGRAMPVVADVTAFDQIELLRSRVEERFGSVDVLVANAGGNPSPPAPVECLSDADWRAAVDGNLTATFLTIKSFLPGMKSRKTGSIITMSSAAARRAHSGSPIAYSAAKAGIQMLTQHVATQVGPYNIRVNCIAPETILTERNRVSIPAPLQAQLADSHPLKRLGSPDDVAHAALFLASSSSDWITGAIIDVSGGAVMTG
jgi:3-oxoacyl-[acyl-carrier protein] reductase